LGFPYEKGEGKAPAPGRRSGGNQGKTSQKKDHVTGGKRLTNGQTNTLMACLLNSDHDEIIKKGARKVAWREGIVLWREGQGAVISKNTSLLLNKRLKRGRKQEVLSQAASLSKDRQRSHAQCKEEQGH